MRILNLEVSLCAPILHGENGEDEGYKVFLNTPNYLILAVIHW